MSKLLMSTNAEYHADKSSLSSSALKQLLKSPEQFYQEYVLGLKTEKQFDHFSEGSFVHMLILEPHKIDEYAIYPGLRKGGKAFEDFKVANMGKTVLSAAQVHRCERMVKAYSSMVIANNLMATGLPEHTMCSSILGVAVKARADFIDPERGIIVDVKTTSLPSGSDVFCSTVAQYMYELSAALYCQIAYDTYGKLFDFYWLVLSKADNQCHVYKASSDTLSRGAALYLQAIVKYKQCIATGEWMSQSVQVSYDTKDYEIEEI